MSPAHQLVNQPVVHRLRRPRLRRLDSLDLGHVIAGHRCIFHDRELHRTFYSPFDTAVLGVTVTVTAVQLRSGSGIVALCRRGRHRQAIGLLDLPLPEPAPEGWAWVEAYRHSAS
ncbi:hypothetical protein ACNPQM_22605 [Streptomyces sp. NPDC056231]|uniref:hypothetical protein n=1 Tax=Streptomyces sp. NPDC056231 TaxID=3345755 RepID=UPI003AABBA66